MGFSTPGNWLQNDSGNGTGGEVADGCYIVKGLFNNAPFQYVCYNGGHGIQDAVRASELKYPGCVIEAVEFHKPSEEMKRANCWKSNEVKMSFLAQWQTFPEPRKITLQLIKEYDEKKGDKLVFNENALSLKM